MGEREGKEATCRKPPPKAPPSLPAAPDARPDTSVLWDLYRYLPPPRTAVLRWNYRCILTFDQITSKDSRQSQSLIIILHLMNSSLPYNSNAEKLLSHDSLTSPKKRPHNSEGS